MIRMHVWLTTVIAVAAGCGSPLGPAIDGRWAARGIELTGANGHAELRLSCTRPIRVPPWARFDDKGHIAFTGAVRDGFSNFAFSFDGQLQQDTLAAVLTTTSPGQVTPWVSNYLMTPDGDTGFDRVICLLAPPHEA